jgi:hypothetical protein
MERTLMSTINEVWNKMKAMEGWDSLDDLLVEDLVAGVENLDSAKQGLFQTSAADVETAFSLFAYRVMELDPSFHESDEYHSMLDCLSEIEL